MKNITLSLLVSIAFYNFSISQVVDYYIPLADLIGMQINGGDVCTDPMEQEQAVIGNTWGFSWTSTIGNAPSSIDITILFAWEEGNGPYPTTLNGMANNPVNPTAVPFCGSASYSIDPTNYIPLGVNTFLMDYSLAVTDNQIIPGFPGSTYVLVSVDYTPAACTTPPTAICQNINIDLDGTGNATIVASDLDGGSIDNCGTSGLTFSATQTAFTCADISSSSPDQALIISGVIDGPLPGGLPKAIELTVANNIPDLSLYGLGSANNGGGTDGEEFTFPAVAATQGQTIIIATESVEFTNFFGFAPDYVSASAPNINGDDAIELFYNSNVVDIFGDISMSGTGQPWEYLDGWVYRNNLTGPDGSVFVLGNWSFSGVSALAGETTNGTAATPFPYASFVAPSSGTSVTLTVTDGNGNTATCVAGVSVQDNMDPTASNPVAINVECSADVPAPDVLVVTDEADNCSIPVVAFVSDVSDGNTCAEIITRTYSVTDDSGNQILVTQTITIDDGTNPTASSPTPLNVECTSDVPAPDVLVVTDETDNCSASPVVAWVGDVSDGNTCPEVITRTYSITDDCGNMITVAQTITVEDITNPLPDGALTPITSSCDVTPIAPTANDNCDGPITAIGDVSFPITAIGTTSVTWTYTDACGNQTIQTQDVTINALDVSVTQSGIDLSANLGTGVTYQWIDCGNGNAWIGGETGQVYTATANGDYAVIITETATGCSDTSICYNVNTIGIEENELHDEINLHPNPTTGKITVNLGDEFNNVTVEVKNIAGQITEEIEVHNQSTFNLTIDGANGIYFINVSIDGSSPKMFKVLKE